MFLKQNIFRAILSGILLCLPWYESFSGLFLCFALVPLLTLEDQWVKAKNEDSRPVFMYASLTFLIWNAGTTWWITNASLAACCTAVLVNTFLYSWVFYLFHLTRKRTGDIIGYLSLVAYWVAFEYFYLNAEISWPWLVLGNGFAHDIKLIQWYEYTGSLGGTVWVLLINILILKSVFQIKTSSSKLYQLLAIGALFVIIPIVISLYIFTNYNEKKAPCPIVIMQPNINPYAPSLPLDNQCYQLTHLADSAGNHETKYFVSPEVAVEDNVWENNIESNYSVPAFQRFIRKYPNAGFIYGSYTYKRYGAIEPHSNTAQYSKASNFYFESYNTAIKADTSRNVPLYHKSKLVVGVEKMPYPKAFSFLKKIVENFGGSFVSHGTQDYRSVFTTIDSEVKIAPVICYESVYGEYVTGYVKNGANLIFVITNDGWWGNTPGHRQHLSYSRLRAIETRRSIARSANTGISAFINQRGEVLKTLKWGVRGAMECSLNANNRETFYVKHGDYLGKMAYLISAGIAILLIFQFIQERIRKPKGI